MTVSKGRQIQTPVTSRPVAARVASLLVAAALLASTAISLTPARTLAADPLSDAIAQQQRLAQLVATQKSQLAQLAQQQTSLAGQIASTQIHLANVAVSVDQLKAEIGDLDGRLAAASASYAALAGQQVSLQRQQAELAALAVARQLELDGRQRILARRLASEYETDQTPLLQQLLTAHSLTEALSDSSYHSAMAAADKALADQIRGDKAVVDQLWQSVTIAAAATADATTQAAARKSQLDEQRAELARASAELADLQSSLQVQLAQQQAAEAELARNQAQLSATIASNGQALDLLGNRIDQLIRQGVAGGGIPSQFSGSLHWPMGGVVTQEFGCTGVLSEPRVGNCAHFHQGIDTAAPCLTPVYAAGAGEVVFAGYNPYDAAPQAWLVIVAHSTSMVTWYAHMTARNPAGIYVGAPVAAGQLVGTENTTGHSTGCHLHWAVRVSGVFENPRLFL